MNGPQVLEVILLGEYEDDCVVAVPTAGVHLHKQGYRVERTKQLLLNLEEEKKKCFVRAALTQNLPNTIFYKDI